MILPIVEATRPLPPFAGAPSEQVDAVRAVLRDTGFDAQTVSQTVRVEGDAPRPARQLPLLLRRTAGGRPVDTLIRLFVMGVTVDREVAEAAFSPLPPAAWERLGLVDIDGGRVRPLVMLRPWDELVVASDRPRRPGAGLDADFVMGISPSSQLLAQLTVRAPAAAALDIGTGSGFQALLAAGHSGAVTATDVNPRALAFARLNAALNGVDLEVLPGSLYEPVAGRRFDLIVSNAPFVIAPQPTHFFLHGGMADDGTCRALARGAAAHLTEAGYCQFLANWLLPNEGWVERLAGWFDDTSCDAWVMQAATYTVEEYAANWVEVDDEETELVPTFDAWMAYFDRLGVGRIAYGLVTMQRASDGRTRLYYDDGPARVSTGVGGHVARGMQLRKQLAAMGDDELLAARPALSPDVRLEQAMVPGDGGWEGVAWHVHRTTGLLYEGSIDPHGARMLGRCDGTRPLAELLEELAGEIGLPHDEVVADALPNVRQMVQQEMLELR